MIQISKTKILLVTILLLFAVVVPVWAGALEDAIKQQELLQQQQSRATGQLNGLTTKAEQMEKQIKQLTAQITAAEIDLAKKEKAYAKVQGEVKVTQEEVVAKQKELDGRQEILRNRVRSIYEDGQINYLEVLFQSMDISDFISRVEYLGSLVENDQNILENISEQKIELNEKKLLLIAKMNEAEKLKEQAEAAKIYLAASKVRKESALAENKKDQDDLLIQIQKMEADSKALEAKIRELQKNNTSGIQGSISVWPTPGYNYITSVFGYRIHPITRKYSLHTGVDIAVPYGKKIISTGSGKVIYSGWYGAYGNAVIIDHGNQLSSLYGHMSSIAVKVNATVVAGQTIGYVGSTGWSTGAHLHFEVRKNGVPVNPLTYFK